MDKMSKNTEFMLDIENIGRIGQIFIDGDALEDVMADPFTCDEDDTDYNIENFNKLKVTLMKIERVNPELRVTGAIVCWYKANKKMAIPAVAGKSSSTLGHVINSCSPALYKALTEDTVTSYFPHETRQTYFFPIKNSCAEVVGALELSINIKQ